MSRRALDLGLGLFLIVGPLGYALTLEPEVVAVASPPEVIVVHESIAGEPAAIESCLDDAAIAESDPEPDPALVETTPSEPAVDPTPEIVAADPADRLRFAFVNDAGIVLSTTADRAWGTGTLRDHAGPGEFRAAKRADLAKVPASHLDQRGRTFDIYGADGKVCTARIGELSILMQHDGPSLFEVFHGSMDGIEWDPEAADESPFEAFDRETHSAREIRSKVWTLAHADTHEAWLVAGLVSDTSCEGGLWARDADLPEPTVLHRAPSPEVTAKRLAAFESSEVLAEKKSAYDAWRDEVEDEEERRRISTWEELAKATPAKVQAWDDARGMTRMVELEFGEEPEGCGDGGDTSITSVDMVVDGRFESIERSVAPLAVFDADLDGNFELLHEGALSSDNPDLSLGLEIYQEFYCPC